MLAPTKLSYFPLNLFYSGLTKGKTWKLQEKQSLCFRGSCILMERNRENHPVSISDNAFEGIKKKKRQEDVVAR